MLQKLLSWLFPFRYRGKLELNTARLQHWSKHNPETEQSEI